MLSTTRLTNLYNLVKLANERKLTGAIVECGVWNGGASAMMGVACYNGGVSFPRTLWLFYSFEGLPRPSERDSKEYVESYFQGLCKGDINKVQKIIRKLGIPLKDVKIIKGWLQATLPSNQIDTIAVLHIETDWYKDVKVVLEHLYDKVVPEGFIVVDDFWPLKGCREAVNDFLKERRLE